MAVVFPVGVEVFANAASCVATSGGTTNPGAGATETWTMGTGNGSFPTAQTSAFPANYFFARDPADTTNEIVLVTDNTTPTSWHVQRGMSGATVSHASGATWVQVIAPYTLGNFKQQPGAATSAVTVAATLTETLVATFQPQSGEIIGGSAWEVVAFGPIITSATATSLTWTLRWGGLAGTSLLTLVTGTNAVALPTSIAAGGSFDVNGSVTLLSATSAVANLNFFANKVAAQVTGVASSQSATTVSGNGPVALTVKWANNTAGNSLTALAPTIYRMA